MNSCYNYNSKLIELIIPKLNILNEVCTSNEKTEMFIIAILRLSILYYLLEYITHYEFLYITANILILLTLVSIFIIIIKVPQEIQDELNKKNNKEIKLFVEQEQEQE